LPVLGNLVGIKSGEYAKKRGNTKNEKNERGVNLGRRRGRIPGFENHPAAYVASRRGRRKRGRWRARNGDP
jgi:hypothetical protein